MTPMDDRTRELVERLRIEATDQLGDLTPVDLRVAAGLIEAQDAKLTAIRQRVDRMLNTDVRADLPSYVHADDPDDVWAEFVGAAGADLLAILDGTAEQ